jgi:hypothetical protein
MVKNMHVRHSNRAVVHGDGMESIELVRALQEI